MDSLAIISREFPDQLIRSKSSPKGSLVSISVSYGGPGLSGIELFTRNILVEIKLLISGAKVGRLSS